MSTAELQDQIAQVRAWNAAHPSGSLVCFGGRNLRVRGRAWLKSGVPTVILESAGCVPLSQVAPAAGTPSAPALTAVMDPRDARILHLENALRGISEFAQAHHARQEPHLWLHALVVDIPDHVETALGHALPTTGGRRAGR
jgi:hypothetical protein